MPAKELLKRNDLKFRLLFQDNPLPMWVFDRQTLRFLEVNQAAVERYGYTREEFLALTLEQIRQSQDVNRQMEPVSGKGGFGFAAQWRHKLKDGRLVDVEVASHAISYGGHEAVLSVLHDVTLRNQLEEHLRQAAKMEAVGMLAGGIAHDFNNLLTIINGYSHILMNSLPLSDPNHSAAEEIMKAGERAAALTQQLLAFSRRKILQPKILNLNELLRGMETMLRRLIGEDVDLFLSPAGDLGRVNADPGQIEQVIMNLVVNARDAMPRGGALTLETSNVELDESYTRTHATMKPGKYVALIVSDNGQGMDAETRKKLFQPFFTTKTQGKGTGLGLTTVFTIVKQSEGGVEVYSEPGKGTSVKVYLPRVDQQAITQPDAPVIATQSGSETILLVEDEEPVRHLVRETLRHEGYNVLDAASAAEARRIGTNYKKKIHLLITDVVMPKEGGRDLARSLTQRRPDMKVLFMSGYTDQAVVNGGLLSSESAFIQKPFTPATLARKVRDILEKDGESTKVARG